MIALPQHEPEACIHRVDDVVDDREHHIVHNVHADDFQVGEEGQHNNVRVAEDHVRKLVYQHEILLVDCFQIGLLAEIEPVVMSLLIDVERNHLQQRHREERRLYEHDIHTLQQQDNAHQTVDDIAERHH
ncbi:hypothetical protein D3C71_1527580 [compost metagenome]